MITPRTSERRFDFLLIFLNTLLRFSFLLRPVEKGKKAGKRFKRRYKFINTSLFIFNLAPISVSLNKESNNVSDII